MPLEMSINDLFSLDNWYLISFETARTDILRTLVQYLGLFPVVPGGNPQTDGKKITLESSIAEFTDDKDDLSNNRNVSMYLSNVLHEMSHILGGTFLVDFNEYLKNNFDQPHISHRIFNIIRDRIDEDHFKADYASPADAGRMVNANNYLIKRRPIPGARADRFLELYSTKLIGNKTKGELLFEKGLKNQDEYEVKKGDRTTLDAEMEFLKGEVKSKVLRAEGLLTLQDLLDRSLKESLRDRYITGSLECTKEVYRLVMKEFRDELPEKPGGSGDGKQDDDKDGKGYARGGKHDYSEAPVKVANDNDLKDKAGEIKDAIEKNKENIKKARQEQIENERKQKINSEFEFDYKRKAYTRRVKVEESVVKERDPAFLAELGKYQNVIDNIVEYLMELRPNQFFLKQGVDEPDEINIENVIEVEADHNLRPNAKVYDSVQINKVDCLVSVLIDISGSTRASIDDNKQVIDVEKAIAGIVYSAMNEVPGFRVDLYAFSSGHGDGTETKVYNVPGLEELGSLRPENANRDGAAIRRVVRNMNDADAKEKWLVVVSDGKPNSEGYEGEYAVKDTARAIQDAENDSGIRVIYLNVDQQAPEYFHELTRSATYAKNFKDPRGLERFGQDLVEIIVR